MPETAFRLDVRVLILDVNTTLPKHVNDYSMPYYIPNWHLRIVKCALQLFQAKSYVPYKLPNLLVHDAQSVTADVYGNMHSLMMMEYAPPSSQHNDRGSECLVRNHGSLKDYGVRKDKNKDINI